MMLPRVGLINGRGPRPGREQNIWYLCLGNICAEKCHRRGVCWSALADTESFGVLPSAIVFGRPRSLPGRITVRNKGTVGWDFHQRATFALTQGPWLQMEPKGIVSALDSDKYKL